MRPCRTCDRAIARKVGDLAHDLVDSKIRNARARNQRIPTAA